MKCINLQTGQIIANNLQMKDGFFERMVGLLGRKDLPPSSGIILKPCTQIHTCFMRFNIDVIFLTKDLEVLYVIENMPPWRLSPLLLKSYYTIELGAGTLKGTVKNGQKISLNN